MGSKVWKAEHEHVSEWGSLSACARVCARKSKSGAAFVRRPITHPSRTSNESRPITAVVWFGSGRKERETSTAHLGTWKNTRTHKHAAHSNFIWGASVLRYISCFCFWWQLLCLAGEDVTKISIEDKQIATDSLTGQKSCRGEKKRKRKHY